MLSNTRLFIRSSTISGVEYSSIPLSGLPSNATISMNLLGLHTLLRNRVHSGSMDHFHKSWQYNASAFVRNNHIHSAHLPPCVLPLLSPSSLNGLNSPFQLSGRVNNTEPVVIWEYFPKESVADAMDLGNPSTLPME